MVRSFHLTRRLDSPAPAPSGSTPHRSVFSIQTALQAGITWSYRFGETRLVSDTPNTLFTKNLPTLRLRMLPSLAYTRACGALEMSIGTPGGQWPETALFSSRSFSKMGDTCTA